MKSSQGNKSRQYGISVSETLKTEFILTWLIAKEDFNTFSHHESFKSYISMHLFNSFCISWSVFV